MDDIARLAQNHDKFPNLDSKNFGKTKIFSQRNNCQKKQHNNIGGNKLYSEWAVICTQL